MKNFPLSEGLPLASLFRERGITDFVSACNFIQHLPYGRISDRSNLSLVLTEGRGTCSSKHGLLAALAVEAGETGVELIAGMFLMSPETHPVLQTVFEASLLKVVPECHCYLRYQGQRFDYTVNKNLMERIAPKIVREQRIDPNQVIEWKEMIHKNYLEGWLKRNPDLALSVEEVWRFREDCIRRLADPSD